MSVATISSVPGARPVVELGVGDPLIESGQAVWDVARWNDLAATWSGEEPYWYDVTCDVHDVEIDIGRDRTIERWQVGTATITLDNRTGVYDLTGAPIPPDPGPLPPDPSDVNVLLEPFNNLTMAPWSTVTGTTPSITTGRTGTAAVFASSGTIGYTIPAVSESDTVTMGFAFRAAVLTANRLVELRSDAGATQHTNLALGTDGALSVTRSSSIILATSPAGLIAVNTWYYIELQYRLGDSGATEVRINGTSVASLTLTGVDTKNAGTKTTYDTIRLNGGSGATMSYDDLYVRTGASATFRGDIPILGLAVVAAGTGDGSGSVLSIRPGRSLRIGVALDANPVTWLYRGFIDQAEPRYDPVQSDTVVLSCVDAKGQAGKVELGALAAPVGASEFASARVARVLNAVRWSSRKRDIPQSSIRVIETSFDSQAVDLMDTAADSAGGAVFGDTRAYVVFRGRDWQSYPASTPPEATIGNVTSADVCPSGWELSWALSDVATRTVFARKGAPSREFDDEDAQYLYGVETFSRTDLECIDDTQVDVLAQRTLEVLSVDFMPRVAAVTIDPATSTAARNLAAAVTPMKPSRYRCRLLEGPERLVFDRPMFATGVQHRIDPHTWSCRIALDDAAPFATNDVRWDAARWNVDRWTIAP